MMTTKSRRILLIEAEQIVTEITAFRLELLGYKVDAAATAEDAQKLLAVHKPDLILIDLHLPGQSGLAYCEQLTTETGTSQIPILAMTDDGESENVQKAFQAGASDLLIIPFDPIVLEEKVAQLLAQFAAEEKLAKKPKKSLVGG
jgi:CheY-like chemotaxis protein